MPCPKNSDLLDLLEELYQAYRAARKNKRNTRSQLQFELNLEENLYSLAKELPTLTYKLGPSSCFIIIKPVQREIFAANFRDRVVHHLLARRINPSIEPRLIHDSYSCRKGKGTLFGVRRLNYHIKSCTENFTKPAWVLKLDIQGYFMNTPRHLLYRAVMHLVRPTDPLTRPLLRQIEAFVREELKLNLHPNKRYLQPTAHGVEFLGVKIRNGALLPGRRISKNAIEAMHAHFHLKEAVPMVNAYLGVLRHMNAYGLRRQIVQMIQPPILHVLRVHPAFLAVKSITPASS